MDGTGDAPYQLHKRSIRKIQGDPSSTKRSPYSALQKSSFLEHAKTADLGEKLDLPDVVFGRDELSQPAEIAGKGSVLGWWFKARLCPLTWNHFGKTF